MFFWKKSGKNLEVAHLFLHKLGDNCYICFETQVKHVGSQLLTYLVHLHVIMPLCVYTEEHIRRVLLHEGTSQHQIAEQLIWSRCVIQGIVDYCRKIGSMKNLPHTGQSGCSIARDNQYLVQCSMTDRRANVPQLKKPWQGHGITVGSTTIRQCFKYVGLYARIAWKSRS